MPAAFRAPIFLDGEHHVVMLGVNELLKLRRGGIVVLFAFVAITVLTACSFISSRSPQPIRSELVGSWIHSGPQNIQTELDLREDGTLEVTNVPRQVFTGDDGLYFSQGSQLQWGHLVSLVGTWDLSKQLDGNQPAIDINVHPAEGEGGVITTMAVDSSGGKRTLSIVVGPVDNGVTFSFDKKSK